MKNRVVLSHGRGDAQRRDCGVFSMFISSTASCTYKNYEILRKYVSAARRQYRHTKKRRGINEKKRSRNIR